MDTVPIAISLAGYCLFLSVAIYMFEDPVSFEIPRAKILRYVLTGFALGLLADGGFALT